MGEIGEGRTQYVACHDCGTLLRAHDLAPNSAAECPRCRATLYRRKRYGLDHAIALHVTGVILFAAANVFPFITFKMEGREQTSTLISGVIEFTRHDLWILAGTVFAVTMAIPLAKLLATLYVLVPVRLGRRVTHAATVFRFVEILHPWAMLEIFLLGVFVAYVKLSDLATLELGPGIYAFGALIIVIVAGESMIEPREIWNALGFGPKQTPPKPNARARFTACHACNLVLFAPAERGNRCPRCGSHLHRRKPNSVQRTWALVLAATVLYLPANIYPVMTVISFGHGEPDTILSGVKALVEANMWPLAILVFFASITVPVLKIVGLSYLLVSVQRRSAWRPRDRTRLFRMIEAVGRWSMIDIFMISILIALVKLGAIATIEPGVGATSFAAVVIITMIASMTFEPRLIWDRMEERHAGS